MWLFGKLTGNEDKPVDVSMFPAYKHTLLRLMRFGVTYCLFFMV